MNENFNVAASHKCYNNKLMVENPILPRPPQVNHPLKLCYQWAVRYKIVSFSWTNFFVGVRVKIEQICEINILYVNFIQNTSS
jgi:hypothetical protein